MRRDNLLKKAAEEGELSGKEFSLLMQDLLIPHGAYIIPIGNWENTNAEVALRLQERIRRHSILWRLFMV